MKFVLAGCTGLIGEAFVKTLLNQNHEIIMLTRNPTHIPSTIAHGVTAIHWNGRTYSDEWAQQLSRADVVVNLSGASIFNLWTKSYKKTLWNSRILTTSLLIEAMTNYKVKPKVFINASAMGYFHKRQNSFSNAFDENSQRGQGFLSDLCAAWEKQAFKAEALEIRTVVPRISIVLDSKKGALPLMSRPFRMYFGHILGEGFQAQPWIHIEDMVSLLNFIISNENVHGVIHAVAPERRQSTHAQFSTEIAKVLSKPLWFHIPEKLIRPITGEVGDMLLSTPFFTSIKSQEHGFSYKYTDLNETLKNLLT